MEVVANLDKALIFGQLALKDAPDNPDSFYALGLTYERHRNFAEAEEALFQTLKVNAGYQDMYFSLGTLYADHVINPPKSVAAFRRYRELGGAHAHARAAVTQSDHAMKPRS